MAKLGPVFQLDGDSYRGQTGIEIALRQRLAQHTGVWTGQGELIRATRREQLDPDIGVRLAQLDQAVADTGNAIIIGRSSGARVATLLAMRKKVQAVICLGYPFQKPRKADEPERYAHLADLSTPTLILQGIDDAYGGRQIIEKYAFSAAITVEFIEADHTFRLSPAQWDAVAARILCFCGAA